MRNPRIARRPAASASVQLDRNHSRSGRSALSRNSGSDPPTDRPREDENFVFVTDGIEAAVAKAKQIAGEKTVAVNSGQMARQALEAGLLDEVGFDLVPVILGAGTRFFAGLEHMPMELEGPILHVEGIGVTHLRYRVGKRREAGG